MCVCVYLGGENRKKVKEKKMRQYFMKHLSLRSNISVHNETKKKKKINQHNTTILNIHRNANNSIEIKKFLCDRDKINHFST